PNPNVIYSAAIALGHRSDPRSISHLVKHIAHKDAQVRYGITFGLGGHEDPNAIAALLQLAKDTDADVRNWAVFGLGTLIDTDSVAIRETLWTAVTDSDSDVRGEALVGLAKRKDPRTAKAILQDCSQHGISRQSFEAAEKLGDPRVQAIVLGLLESPDLDEDAFFGFPMDLPT